MVNTITLFINEEVDILKARKIGMEMAAKLNFKEIEAAEIEITIGELGTNIIKYGKNGGVITLTVFSEKNHVGLEIVSKNQPREAIEDICAIEKFLIDRYSSSGSLGIGLSGIKRLMDDFGFGMDETGQLIFRGTKYSMTQILKRMNCSVMNRPKMGELVSGDGYFTRQLPHIFFWSVIDALGHGPEAHRAAKRMENVLAAYFKDPLSEIIQRCHIALKKERGAASCLGRINFEKEIIEYISIGNIETRIYHPVKHQQLPFINGTVGILIPEVQVFCFPYLPQACIVSYTDGISSRYNENTDLYLKSPQEISNYIISNHSKEYDDATVMVIKEYDREEL